MKQKFDPTLISSCLEIYQNGGSRGDVASFIREETSLGKTQSFEWAKRIADGDYVEEDDINEEVPDHSSLEFSDKYVFNKEEDKYVFLTESKLGKNIVLSSDKVKGIIKSYSNFKGSQSSINEVAIKFDIPRRFVIEILKCLEITHDSLPVTNEDLSEKQEDQLVEEILQEKRFALHQKIEKRDWIETQKYAEKWREFEVGVLNPLEEYLNQLEFKPLPKFKNNISSNISDEEIVIGCFDWQIGAKADGRLLFFGEEWSTEKALRAVEEFSNKIIKKSKTNKINKATVIFGGDIFHGLNGLTAKETELKCDTLRFDQFDSAVNAIVGMLQRFTEYFDSVECKIVTGNHEGFSFYPLFRLVESIFQNNLNINFDICRKEFMHFRVKDSMFLVHHGASADYKYKIPADKKGRTALALKCFKIAEREGDYDGVKRRFFIKGDTHSFEGEDLGSDIMFYTFGCLPTGDEYANALALDGTPTQNALIIGEGRDFDTVHITF